MTDRDWMVVQTETLFVIDDQGRLRATNDPVGLGREAPRFFLGRTRNGHVWRFREDLSEALVRDLEAVCVREPVGDGVQPVYMAEYCALLEAHGAISRVWCGPAYRFPEGISPEVDVVRVARANGDLLRGGFEDTVGELDDIQPCVAVVRDGRAVALCQSVRKGNRAYEAGLDTLEAHRRKGYGAAAAAGWAVAVRELGRTPFYSTSWENMASQGVAKKLGLICYGVDFHIT